MASLGDLVVKLSLDAAGFQSDMGKASYEAEKGMAQIVASGVLAGNVLTKLAEVAVEAAVKIVTFGFEVAKSVQEQTDALGEAAQAAGVTTAAYQTLAAAAALSGVASDQFTAALTKLNVAIVHAAEGEPKIEAAFKKLGVAVTDSQGYLRDTEAVFADLNKAFQEFPEGPLKAALAVEIFGKAGAKLIPAMNADMMELGKSARDVGAIMSDELVKASDDYEKATAKLDQSIQGVRNTIAEGMLPAMSLAEIALDDLARSFLGAKDRAEAVIALREGMITVLKETAYWTAFAVDVFVTLKDMFMEIVDTAQLVIKALLTVDEVIERLRNADFSGARQALRNLGTDVDDWQKRLQERLNREPLRFKVEAAFATAEAQVKEMQFQAQLPQSPAYRDDKRQKVVRTDAAKNAKARKDQAAKELREFERDKKQWNDEVDRAQEQSMRASQKAFDDQKREAEKLAAEREREAEKEKRRREKVMEDDEKDRQKAFEAIVKERQQYADVFETGVAGLFVDIVQGTKSVGQAFSDMADSIVQSIEKIIAKKLAVALFESIFGSETSGEGGFGEIIKSIVGGYFGASGSTGGVGASEGVMITRQHGGPVREGQMVTVGERGPETFRAGFSGRVEPIRGGDTTHNSVNVNVNVPQSTDRRSADQIGASVGLAVQRAIRRTQ